MARKTVMDWNVECVVLLLFFTKAGCMLVEEKNWEKCPDIDEKVRNMSQ